MNLLSGDCKLSADVYAEVFYWEVISRGVHHAELRTDSGLLVYFSPDSGICRAGIGSLTLEGEPRDKFLKRNEFFQKEQEFPGRGYQSYLDIYGNRIWFYKKRVEGL